VVTVHEYDERLRRFLPNSSVAGQLKEVGAIGGHVNQDDVRWEIVRLNRAVFPTEDGNDFFLQKNFSRREDIKSVAALPLRAGAALVGVLFISFRHRRIFSPADKKTLLDLAAAYGTLMNQYRRTPRRRLPHTAATVEFVAQTIKKVRKNSVEGVGRSSGDAENRDLAEVDGVDGGPQVRNNQSEQPKAQN
jgi:hypothetical protein